MQKTIIHIDGDAFFAACEQAIHPQWVGQAVITGAERGIVSAASYEAKARGVSRGTPLWEVKNIIPNAIIVPSDYETYGLFSQRMFDIVRRITSDVEEYGIDEAFADITGLDRVYGCSSYDLCLRLQKNIFSELGISVSIGIGSSKVLAKVGSKWNKPHGIVQITDATRREYLSQLPVGKVWGIGRATAQRCAMMSIRTAGQFASLPETMMSNSFYKPFKEIWHELNGTSVFPLHASQKSEYKSISKTKTFTPPSGRPAYLKARLMRNLENACIKARRHGLIACGIGVYLRKQDFRSAYIERRLALPSAYPSQIYPVVEQLFDTIFEPGNAYRATGITLLGLRKAATGQQALFSSYDPHEKFGALYKHVDMLNSKYGKHTVALGTALSFKKAAYHTSSRSDTASRIQSMLPGETSRQRINLPMLHVAV